MDPVRKQQIGTEIGEKNRAPMPELEYSVHVSKSEILKTYFSEKWGS